MPRTYQLRVTPAAGGNPARSYGAKDITRLEFAYRERQVGQLVLDLPQFVPDTAFPLDGRITVERSIDGAAASLEGERCWLVRKVERLVKPQGVPSTRIVAVDGNDLLRRRIVDYDAGTAYTSKSGPADDVMKAIIRENLVSATDATRNLSSDLFSVAIDHSLAPTIDVGFTRRNVLAVLQDICDAITQAGTYLTFDVTWNGSSFGFETYVGQRGMDHSGGAIGQAGRVLIGPAYRNMTDARVVVDATDEATRIIAGGQGEEADREIARADNTVRQGVSPFGLIEDFTNQSNIADATQLAHMADAALQAERVRSVISGAFVDMPSSVYGRHFGFGDLVSVEVAGAFATARVDAVHVTVEGGQETLDIRLRAEV